MVFGFGGSRNNSQSSLPVSPAKSRRGSVADPNALSLPIKHPLPGTPLPKRPEITKENQDKIDYLISHFSDEGYALPSALSQLKPYWKLKAKQAQRTEQGAHARRGTDASVMTLTDEEGLEPLGDKEKFWLTNEQIQRCLRAVKWDIEKAIQRAEETLVWRREYRTDDLSAAEVEEEGETGKQYLVGYDKQSRPCLYMHPYRQNTKVSPRQIQFVVWTLERAVDLMPPGVENLALCIDFGASQGGGQPTSIGQARQVLYILQTYYGERLGRAICVDVPTIFWAFYKLIQGFIDPVTKDKLRFVRDDSEARELVDPKQLISEDFGGDLNFVYNHEEYYQALDKLCQERRKAQFERWQTICESKIGASEYIIKGGEDDRYKKDQQAASSTTKSTTSKPLSSSPESHSQGLPGSETSAAGLSSSGQQSEATAMATEERSDASEILPPVSSEAPSASIPFASPALSTYELAPLASVSAIQQATVDPFDTQTPMPRQSAAPFSDMSPRATAEHPSELPSQSGLADSLSLPMSNVGLGKAVA